MNGETPSLPENIMAQVKQLEAEFPDDLVAVFDAGGMYRYASSRQEELLGYRPDELVGRMNWRDVVVEADKPHMELTWSDAELTGSSIDVSFRVQPRSGVPVKVHGNSRQVVTNDGTRYWVSRVWLVD